MFVGFLILAHAKLRMLELYYNFFAKFCDVNKFEELEMDTDSLYPAPAEREKEDCIRPEMKTQWQQLGSKDCNERIARDVARRTDVTSNKFKFSSKDLNKLLLEKYGDGLLEKRRGVLDENENNTSTGRGFRTDNHTVAAYEQV